MDNLNAEKVPPVAYSLEKNDTRAVFQFSADVKSMSKLRHETRKCLNSLRDFVGVYCDVAVENTESDLVLNIPQGNDPNHAEFYKIAVLGHVASGKSTLVDRFVGNASRRSKVMIGLDVLSKDICLNSNVMSLQLWDACHSINPMLAKVYLKETVGIVLTVDLTKSSGLNDAEPFIRQCISPDTGLPKVPMILVGTKSDMEGARAIPRQHLEDFAQEWGVPYMECSAMEDLNVSPVFEMLAKMIFANQSPRYVCRIQVTPRYLAFTGAISDALDLGEAKGEGECFFDACAQGLNEMSGREEYTIKSLRLLCHEYVVALDKQCGGDPNHPDNWIAKLFNTPDDYQQYFANIRYTTEERAAGEGLGSDRLAVWGRQHVEGRMICERFGVKLHVVEVQENPDDETNKNQKYVVSHDFVDRSGLKNLERESIDWNDAKTIHIGVSNLHFVPILKKATLQRSLAPTLEIQKNRYDNGLLSLLPRNIIPSQTPSSFFQEKKDDKSKSSLLDQCNNFLSQYVFKNH